MNLETRYLESLARLKQVATTAPHTAEGDADYLKAYNACKALYVKVWRREQLPRWYKCALLRRICGEEYERWQGRKRISLARWN